VNRNQKEFTIRLHFITPRQAEKDRKIYKKLGKILNGINIY